MTLHVETTLFRASFQQPLKTEHNTASASTASAVPSPHTQMLYSSYEKSGPIRNTSGQPHIPNTSHPQSQVRNFPSLDTDIMVWFITHPASLTLSSAGMSKVRAAQVAHLSHDQVGSSSKKAQQAEQVDELDWGLKSLCHVHQCLCLCLHLDCTVH